MTIWGIFFFTAIFLAEVMGRGAGGCYPSCICSIFNMSLLEIVSVFHQGWEPPFASFGNI